MTYATHPFDVVGWDGCLYPYTFNVEDFMPITGQVHQPPPVHQVFEGCNFVVCNFLPAQGRLPPAVDPGAVLPLQRRQRRGHVLRRRRLRGAQGLRHQHRLDLAAPGRLRARPAAVGDRGVAGGGVLRRVAVMVDTFAPLDLGEGGLAAEDPAYAWTWAGRGPDAGATATAGRRSSRTRDAQSEESTGQPGGRGQRPRGRCASRSAAPSSPIGAFLAQTGAELIAVNLTYLIGGVFFSLGGWLSILVDDSPVPGPVERGRCCSSAPCSSRSAWWRPSPRGSPPASPNTWIWLPDIVGCVCFLVSGHLAMLDVGERPGPASCRGSADWWIVAINQLGSVLFFLAGLAAFVRPATSEAVNVGLVNWGTFAGAVCFAVAGIIQMRVFHARWGTRTVWDA